MRKAERAEIIRKELKNLYPSPPIPLDHTNAFTNPHSSFKTSPDMF